MKRRKIQLIAICLFFSLLLSTFSINLHALNYESVSDSTNTSPTDTSTPSTTDIIEKIEEDDTRLATEILSRRERTIKHFNLGNGIYQAVSYGMPVHRRDANGEWIDIDNRLYPTEENARHYATADGRVYPIFICYNLELVNPVLPSKFIVDCCGLISVGIVHIWCGNLIFFLICFFVTK